MNYGYVTKIYDNTRFHAADLAKNKRSNPTFSIINLAVVGYLR